MNKANIFNPVPRYKKNPLPFWQQPSLLFAIMGGINIVSCITFYIIGARYIQDPRLVAIIVLGMAFIMIVITYVITQSLERLVQINEIKEEFIKIISHQLRTPLTNINWAIDFLISKPENSAQNQKEEYYQIIKENSQKLLKLFNNLLLITKIRENEYKKNEEVFDINDIIDEMIENYSNFALARRIKIEKDFPPASPLIMGNIFLIKTLVENILYNAILYNKPGGSVKITVSEKNKKILVGVKDRGIGIPEKHRKYIFQQFFRGADAFHAQTQGVGIGLYICKMIVESMKGKIWFETEERTGTTFYFYLPSARR